MNIVPVLMPPTWIVLSTLYFLFPQQFSLIPLVVLGAFASTLGRVILCRIGTVSRRIMSDERRRSMDTAGKALKSTKYGGFVMTFLYALSPLPSNAYFLTMGTMKCHFFSIFLGFWLGRLVSYSITTAAANTVFNSLGAVFTNQIFAVALLDFLALAVMIVFLFIDWEKLFHERRLVFIRPRLFLRKPS
jgi:membrane protein YqaA with SNARE-associated domain